MDQVPKLHGRKIKVNYEIIGLTATTFVLLSFLMREVKSIRIVNIIGAVCFVIYGMLINSLSTWIMNGVLIVIHVIYLVKIYKSESEKKEK